MSQTTKTKLSRQLEPDKKELKRKLISQASLQRASCLASQLKRKLISQARLRRIQCQPDNKEQVSLASC